MDEETPRTAWLILEDGSIVAGGSFGASGTAYGELVFNTGMSGYQESLTDPSYNGQVLMFTYPMVGNYGVNAADWESDRVWPRAVVVREWCRKPSHRHSTRTLHDWLSDAGVVGITGVDTRALTLKTREKGCLRCFVTTDASQVDDLAAKVASMPSPEVDNLAGEASVDALATYGQNADGELVDKTPFTEDAFTVAVIDTGIKRNILRNLVRRFNVLHFPWDVCADDVEARRPDCLFLANGPGDPAHPEIRDKTIATIRTLAPKMPTYGICYGNQLIALAHGGSTYKMKFGHRGANVPVRDEKRETVRITSQNHGFAVDGDSLDGSGLLVWERCPNDQTVEALHHAELPIFTTQYHPEAAPGPWDSGYLFDAFHRVVEDCKRGRFQPGTFDLARRDRSPFSNATGEAEPVDGRPVAAVGGV